MINDLGFGIFGIVLFVVVLGFVIWSMVFWILMIIHAAKHNVENKAMWIILMVFTGFIGAIIYYFVVKRTFSEQFSPPAPLPTPPAAPPTPPISPAPPTPPMTQ